MLPLPPAQGFSLPPLDFAQYFILFQAAFWMLIALLPRAWFCAIFRVAFPFVPERLEGLDEGENDEIESCSALRANNH